MNEFVCEFCEEIREHPSRICDLCWQKSGEEDFRIGKQEGFQEAYDQLYEDFLDNPFHAVAFQAQERYKLGATWVQAWKGLVPNI